MASFDQHAADCYRFLHDRCEEVNRWMDELFAIYGPDHRKYRHHREGIQEAEVRFGKRGVLAATIHVLRDCRHVPRKADYESRLVDGLGMLAYWPATAYFRYDETDFETLVMNELVGNTGRVLWAFINEEGLVSFLSGVSRYGVPEVQNLAPKAASARLKAQSLPPVSPPVLPSVSFDQKSLEYIKSSQTIAAWSSQLGKCEVAYVSVKDLVTPLVFVDNAYLEELRPELQSLDADDVVRFAMPNRFAAPVRMQTDPAGKSATFVSKEKTLTTGEAQIIRSEGQTEVRFSIGGSLSVITVSVLPDRLLIRNGIHRAYLLMKLGVKEIPCVLVAEQSLPSLISTAFPSFVPSTLLQPRPPLLVDLLDDELSLDIPLLRTQKVIRISVEELIVPVD